ncbi:MAG: hypothetical protein WDM96_04035 [Lacunisphaera sp.]
MRGKSLRPVGQPKITLVMHKPRGVICSNSDPHEDRTIFDLFAARMGPPAAVLRRPPRQGFRRPRHPHVRRRSSPTS